MYSVTEDGVAAMENGRREDQVARNSLHDGADAELDEVSSQGRVAPPFV